MRFARWTTVVAVVLAIAFWWFFRLPREAREIERMPAHERRALFDRTMQTLRTTCAGESGRTLTRFCSDQAEFIATFPECDHECHALVERYVGPTR